METRRAEVGRRDFLRTLPLAAAALVSGASVTRASVGLASPRNLLPNGAAGIHRVGVGHSTDPYTATLRAVAACDEWPAAAIAGQTVLIKPNLVGRGLPASSGVTTDPQVVRALVDLSLDAGARQVLIIEGGAGSDPPPFAACGYGFLDTYDPQGRVRLHDLAFEPLARVDAPNGSAYQSLWVPDIVANDEDLVLISAGKLKCHVNTGVSLSLKNLVGLAAPSVYSAPRRLPRWDLHERGIGQSILDLNLACPVNFAVIDGVWGMQGDGPLFGMRVRVDRVLAGANALAVDLTALQVMGVSQSSVPHLAYAPSAGLGPADMSEVDVRGDAFTPMAFQPARTPPIVWAPTVMPAAFAPREGEQTTIQYSIPSGCWTLVEIIRDGDFRPAVRVVRRLQRWMPVQAGTASVQWDGLGEDGHPVRAGSYLARVRARYSLREAVSTATRRISVT